MLIGAVNARLRQWPSLELLVFCVGCTTLGSEIAVARLIAPFFGDSTIVWANTIAIVLVALSAGYWLGGRMADRHPHRRGLCLLVLAAAALLAIAPLVARPFLRLSVNAFDEISVGVFAGSLFGVLALVAVPVLMLGAVSPWAIRLKLEHVEDSGEVAGRLYAISTAGSLVGTFAASLLLIPLVGTQRTFLVFALLLALVAAPGVRALASGAVPAAIVVLLVIPTGTIKGAEGDGRVLYETETAYQYARVVGYPDGERKLELNEGQAVHSVYRADTVLTDDYWDDMLVLPFALAERTPERIAILGNAGGTTARAYGHYFPRTLIDAVEIDGELTDIARRWFGMRERPQLRVHDEDARPFLRRVDERYDLIVVDAYRQPYIPFYLATREFFALARDHLADDGMIVINVGHPEDSEKLERTLAATMGAALNHIARDPVQDTNTLLIGSQRPIDPERLRAAVPRLPAGLRPLARATAARIAPRLDGGTVYTDDRAPVEFLIDSSLVDYAVGR